MKQKLEQLLSEITAGENVQIKQAILILAEEIDQLKKKDEANKTRDLP